MKGSNFFPLFSFNGLEIFDLEDLKLISFEWHELDRKIVENNIQFIVPLQETHS